MSAGGDGGRVAAVAGTATTPATTPATLPAPLPA